MPELGEVQIKVDNVKSSLICNQNFIFQFS